MHIKQVIISGFKSYRDETVIEPFSSRHNVIVGRNGSGKSNFFHAIQFVLSDEFSNLSPSERQGLIHESSGQRQTSAFVEIIFDNEDFRIPVDNQEVVVRRTISGSKQDQYYLDRKTVSRSEIVNVLESAGFSRSNPYYIVKQGQIAQLATATERDRLQLLKEVAGTSVYDDRKKESQRILEETAAKRSNIDEVLDHISERLHQLESETAELKEYQKWDKNRRAMELTLFEQEMNDASNRLKALQQEREKSMRNAANLRDQQAVATERVAEMRHKLEEFDAASSASSRERAELDAEMQRALARAAQLELALKDLQEEAEADSRQRGETETELEEVRADIVKAEERLAHLERQLAEARSVENENSAQLAAAERRKREFAARWGDGSGTTEERKRWLRTEITKAQSTLDENVSARNQLHQALTEDVASLKQFESRLHKTARALEEHKKETEKMAAAAAKARLERDRLQAERSELWRREVASSAAAETAREDAKRSEQGLRSAAGRGVLAGINSIDVAVEHLRKTGDSATADGYHGLLMDCFSCDRSLYVAIEVAAGNRLYNHVVANDKVATRLLAIMNKEKLSGEASFLPLSRLKVKPLDGPLENSNAQPLINHVKYDSRYERAIQHVFGRVLVCRSLEHATSLARETKLDCVTLEGDLVSAKGLLSGGWQDNRRLRLEMRQHVQELTTLADERQRELDQVRNELEGLEMRVAAGASEAQRCETELAKVRDKVDSLQTEARVLQKEVETLRSARGEKQRRLAATESNNSALAGMVDNLKAELLAVEKGGEAGELVESQAQTERENLAEEVDRCRQKTKESTAKRQKLEADVAKIDRKLSDNLRKRLGELEMRLSLMDHEGVRSSSQGSASSQGGQQMTALRNELDAANRLVDTARHRLISADETNDVAARERRKAAVELDKWETDERKAAAAATEAMKAVEKAANKQTVAQRRAEECARQIKEVGTVAQEALERVSQMSAKQLMTQLEKCRAELAKLGHVNKKALEQFTHFSEQQEKLTKRREELDKSLDSIQELMDALDQRKFEAVDLTFKQVGKNFADLFARLVPNGRGQLVMITSSSDEKNDDGTDNNNNNNAGGEGDGAADGESANKKASKKHVKSAAASAVDRFKGVAVRVSFGGAGATGAEMRELHQLSGGQKTLVALTMIFAIQRCDPAPFYLFDEVDAALDAEYRRSVASVIADLSNSAQFIMTTFRPELLEHADRFYGVRFRNKVSFIQTVSREEAMDFIESEPDLLTASATTAPSNDKQQAR